MALDKNYVMKKLKSFFLSINFTITVETMAMSQFKYRIRKMLQWPVKPLDLNPCDF